ncbi:MAG: phospholipase D family protein [Paracoccus sp. (in: a-proteobacteria)]|nr:phospholipase D family protein [Paracoccus sp. (in: a-proteobacteria)]
MRIIRFLAILALVLAAAITVMRLLFPLPDISARRAQPAIAASDQTRLGALMAQAAADHPGLSGIVPLEDGHDALASRLALINAAEVSIDSQYYIWHDDLSGIILLDALDRAAQRGVRVRLLLDDNGVPGLDPFMAALNAGPDFEIRLFNPSTIRSPKLLGYSFDFFRMNRRMHNKSLIVDGAAAIIGGRNIGDEYFELGDAFYKDLDALAIGPVVVDTARSFDDYWNSASVFGVGDIIAGTGDRAGYDARVAAVTASPEAGALENDLQSSFARYAGGAQALEWTQVQLVVDDPAKGQGIASRDQLMIARLGQLLGEVSTRLDLVSAYFVPGKPGTEYFTDLAQEGKQVSVLTNALNTTDVLLVHSGYTKYRRELLEAGVKLYELKLRGGVTPESETQLKPLGLSGASLHAKTFAVDDERVFIGSFNFDPRSAMLNCEMGFLIDSPTIARRISSGFDGPLAQVSYRPELSADDRMVWQEDTSSGTVTWQQEPGANWFQQIALTIIGLLPVEWLL